MNMQQQLMTRVLTFFQESGPEIERKSVLIEPISIWLDVETMNITKLL